MTSRERLNSQKIKTLVPALPAVWPWTSPLSSPGYFHLYLDIDQDEHSGALRSSKLVNLCSGRPLSCRDGRKKGA